MAQSACPLPADGQVLGGNAVIDLHCHALPGLDDGPSAMDGALAMTRVAVASGIRTLVATPHINHRWHVAVAEVARRARLLAQALADEGIAVEIDTGGEIDLARLADLASSELDALRLGEGPYLLLDTPP